MFANRLIFSLSLLLTISAYSIASAAQQPIPLQNSSGDNQEPAELEVERISISESGALPQEISRPKGRFILLLEIADRGAKAQDFVLLAERPEGTRDRSDAIRLKMTEFRKLAASLNLSPGLYSLTSDASDHVLCVIRVQ